MFGSFRIVMLFSISTLYWQNMTDYVDDAVAKLKSDSLPSFLP